MPRSTKQKDESRRVIATTIAILSDLLRIRKNWKLNISSFQSSEETPLDFVEFNEKTRRYQYIDDDDEAEEESACTNKQKRSLLDKNKKAGFAEDDLIAQSMIVYLLYRMEKGWGDRRSFQALPIWGGKPAKKDKDEDDPFPLENLWEEEIKELIAAKKLGKTTLNHHDNFWSWCRFYGDYPEPRWMRRSETFLGQVHTLAEQAAIQMALYLHKNVSEHYAKLAATIIDHAIAEGGTDDLQLMRHLVHCILETARREVDNFPKIATNLIEMTGQYEMDNQPTSSKKQKIESDESNIKQEDVTTGGIKKESSNSTMKEEDAESNIKLDDADSTIKREDADSNIKREDVDSNIKECWV